MLAPTQRSWIASSPLLLLAVVPSIANASSASRARHHTTRNIAADLLNSVEPYGVLVTVGDNDTFPLWYAQEVEGIRRDVIVANTSLLNTDWYVRQIIRRQRPDTQIRAREVEALLEAEVSASLRCRVNPEHEALRHTLGHASPEPPFVDQHAGSDGQLIENAGQGAFELSYPA